MLTSGRDLVGYGEEYPRIKWPGGARIAISLVINFEEGSEMSPLIGDAVAEPTGEAFPDPAGQRRLINESLFEYGSRRGFWRLLEIFDKYEVKVTSSSCAVALEMNPESAKEITARGHESASHGYRWAIPAIPTRDEERELIRKAVDATLRTTGVRPLGWASTTRTERTRELLVEEGGYLYDSDSQADDLPYFVNVRGKKWLVVPYDVTTNDMLFSHLPGYAEPDDYFFQLKEAFDYLYEEGASHPKMMSVGIHLRFAGRPGRSNALDEFIRYARSFPGVWFARRIDIARWWLQEYGDLPVLPRPRPKGSSG
jgi:peptidoglycan/xylan/chitin deacetylase (PgdA/CDA1 family)